MKKRKGAIKATIRSWVDVKFGLQRIGGCFTSPVIIHNGTKLTPKLIMYFLHRIINFFNYSNHI